MKLGQLSQYSDGLGDRAFLVQLCGSGTCVFCFSELPRLAMLHWHVWGGGGSVVAEQVVN